MALSACKKKREFYLSAHEVEVSVLADVAVLPLDVGFAAAVASVAVAHGQLVVLVQVGAEGVALTSLLTEKWVIFEIGIFEMHLLDLQHWQFPSDNDIYSIPL